MRQVNFVWCRKHHGSGMFVQARPPYKDDGVREYLGVWLCTQCGGLMQKVADEQWEVVYGTV